MSVGSRDIGTLHKRLGELRRKAALQADDGRGEFLCVLMGDYSYRSHLSAVKYGQNADIGQTATQIGGNLFGFESDASITRMGLSGSYGSVSFNPQRSDSQKTKMDTWVVMPYVNWQHDSGAYVDTVVSYGTFKGTVTTAARGRTATLQGTRMAASVEVGRPFALPVKGLTVSIISKQKA